MRRRLSDEPGRRWRATSRPHSTPTWAKLARPRLSRGCCFWCGQNWPMIIYHRLCSRPLKPHQCVRTRLMDPQAGRCPAHPPSGHRSDYDKWGAPGAGGATAAELGNAKSSRATQTTGASILSHHLIELAPKQPARPQSSETRTSLCSRPLVVGSLAGRSRAVQLLATARLLSSFYALSLRSRSST